MGTWTLQAFVACLHFQYRDMHVQCSLEGFDYERLCMHYNASSCSVQCFTFHMQQLFV